MYNCFLIDFKRIVFLNLPLSQNVIGQISNDAVGSEKIKENRQKGESLINIYLDIAS